MIIQNNLTLKIAVIGPQRVGKTVLSNSLAEYLNVPSPDYRPTAGCRILEVEKIFTDEQIKNIKYLKTNNINKCKIQLWDVSGDKRFIYFYKLDMSHVGQHVEWT
jgi:GTPase SAR1 family protein